MKKILIFAMILLFAGCADWDGAGRRDGGRHDIHERDSQRQEQGHDHGGH